MAHGESDENEYLLFSYIHCNKTHLDVIISVSTSLNQQLLIVSGQEYKTSFDMLEQPSRENLGLEKLFTRPSP